MDPITGMMLALGIGKTVTGLFKTGFGLYQRQKGKNQQENLLEKLERGEFSPPEYDYKTPESLTELSNLYADYLAQEQKREGFPRQDLMEQNIQQMASSQIQNLRESARTSSQALGGTVDLSSQMIENLQQLEIQGAIQAADRELKATQMYGSALAQKGQLEAEGMEKEWQRNEYMPWKIEEYMPWRTRLAQAQSDYAAGLKNIGAGVGDIASGIGYGAGYYATRGEGEGGGKG